MVTIITSEEYKELVLKASKYDEIQKEKGKTVEDKIEKIKELWDFYEAYNSKMRELNYIDFYDMINIVLKNFEGEIVLSFLSNVILIWPNDSCTKVFDINIP